MQYWCQEDPTEASVLKTVNILRKAVPSLNVREFKGTGHFTLEDVGKVEFPELLQTLTTARPVTA